MNVKNVLNNEYVQKGLTTAANAVKTGIAIIGPVVISAIATGAVKQVQDKVQFGGVVGYGDAVKAILESDLYSSAMEEAISILGKDKDQEYYRAVIRVVNSNAYSSAKLRMIKEIGGMETGGA